MSLQLPKEIERYIASLLQIYKLQDQKLLQQLLANAEIIIEEYSYDGWDGGQYGFLLHLLVPDTIFVNVVEEKNKYEKEIQEKLNKLIKISGEFIDSVSIEMRLVEEDNWREKSGLVVQHQKHISNNILERIWKPMYVRAFFSHKAEYKTEVGTLKDELGKYGVSCFVAHKDIEPTKEWLQEIENALFSMDVLIALMTKDFHDSDWTDQEVGVAVGRHIPIVSVKINKDPYGFIGKYQALSGTWDNIPKMAGDIFDVVIKGSASQEKIKRAIIHALKNSSSFEMSKVLINKGLAFFDKMEAQYVSEIINSFNANNQLNECWTAQNKLPPLLCKWTGKQYTIEDEKIIEKTQQSTQPNTDDIPF